MPDKTPPSADEIIAGLEEAAKKAREPFDRKAREHVIAWFNSLSNPQQQTLREFKNWHWEQLHKLLGPRR